mmetsp:Transcript_1603/g.1957  ORF Transcript_1603/g.1957 Transcript_1603/m.1957 type:complete len:134 (-) Transcript_1603:118-519(-)
MPESHKAERRRAQKQNVAAGIGDENGRIPHRVKAEAKIAKCVICQQEFTITKSNTELKVHAENKHGKTIEVCFPGAEAIAADMQKAGGKKGKETKSESSKAKKKASTKIDLDALLDAGISGGPGAKKKKGSKK